MQTTETKRSKAVMPDLGQVLARLPSKGGQDFYSREEPVQVFSEDAGLGKTYAGFRITFRIKEGRKLFSKFTTLEPGEIIPKREDPSPGEIAKFKADILKEAKNDPRIMPLIENHCELQISF